MEKNKKELKAKVKKLLEFSKKKKYIKPHTEAFEIYPVEDEIHKGNKDYYDSEKEETECINMKWEI